MNKTANAVVISDEINWLLHSVLSVEKMKDIVMIEKGLRLWTHGSIRRHSTPTLYQ